MELPYSYNSTEGWYKPDGQSQTIIMRRTSLGTTSLSTTSPTTSQPNSRTGTLDSDRSAGRENRDPNATKANVPNSTQHARAHQVPAAARVQLQSQPNTKANYASDTFKSRANDVEKRFIGHHRDATAHPMPAPSPPASSVYSYGSGPSSTGGNSMERALLPKRRAANGNGSASRGARATRAGAGLAGVGASGKAKITGQAGKVGRVMKRPPNTAIYVNELGPNGSWYIPKKPKDSHAPVSSTTNTTAAVEPGLMKTLLNAFKKKNKVANAPLQVPRSS
ncbi:hypothetical protein JR316_0006632 [Psilocybe cubensis]|uniref:Uncharacterized protein n=2 Tax=Psilocybe cubensis TaxID=181762 RepID=A0A8H7XKS3_PSICU|nr:hypothetical protein JR316_0006632 [Psilocybe cubensis]KAH9480035.1 hypothetical protein JR316_0006632 [Psilocybe cubensis]